MKFTELIQLLGDEPLFETGLLLAGNVDSKHIRRQLSRWSKAGKIHQLRRGLYVLSPPYQKVNPHPFIVANRLVGASYVSLQSALAHYGLIPEYVATITSVTTIRPGRRQTLRGDYEYRHIQPEYFWGYQPLTFITNQQAFIARPEKALLDLVYLTPGGDTKEFLQELRLQNLDVLSLDELRKATHRMNRPKLFRAANIIAELKKTEAEEFVTL